MIPTIFALIHCQKPFQKGLVTEETAKGMPGIRFCVYLQRKRLRFPVSSKTVKDYFFLILRWI